MYILTGQQVSSQEMHSFKVMTGFLPRHVHMDRSAGFSPGNAQFQSHDRFLAKACTYGQVSRFCQEMHSFKVMTGFLPRHVHIDKSAGFLPENAQFQS